MVDVIVWICHRLGPFRLKRPFELLLAGKVTTDYCGRRCSPWLFVFFTLVYEALMVHSGLDLAKINSLTTWTSCRLEARLWSTPISTRMSFTPNQPLDDMHSNSNSRLWSTICTMSCFRTYPNLIQIYVLCQSVRQPESKKEGRNRIFPWIFKL